MAITPHCATSWPLDGAAATGKRTMRAILTRSQGTAKPPSRTFTRRPDPSETSRNALETSQCRRIIRVVNERLRTAMVRRGLAVAELAEICDVDPKSVERWISPGRIPHRRHRWAVAHKLGFDETYLWPDLLASADDSKPHASHSEILETYPDRASVPRETWLRLVSEAQEQIDVLVFSGTFFAQTQPRIAPMLAERLAAGVQVRLCFGEPNSPAVAIRDSEERLGGTLGAKIRASLSYYRELASAEGCQIRLHGTTLYASLFRYDGEMILNPHAWGAPASTNPAFHLRHLDRGTLFAHYAESFERVWGTAQPWLGEKV